MTASGQVAKYRARVVQPGGEAVDSEVIRIGPFTATADGQFLSYLPNLRTLNVLPRQLPGEFMEIAGRFTNATSGYAQAVVDSDRGVLLGLYVERPTHHGARRERRADRLIIIIVGALGAAGVRVPAHQSRARAAGREQPAQEPRPADGRTTRSAACCSRSRATRAKIEEDSDVAELRITEAVLREVPKLERFQAFLRLCVAAGPLLGLIGTVVGMILTFQSITESGSSDPKLMATGIGSP